MRLICHSVDTPTKRSVLTDAFLQFNEHDALPNAERVSKKK